MPLGSAISIKQDHKTITPDEFKSLKDISHRLDVLINEYENKIAKNPQSQNTASSVITALSSVFTSEKRLPDKINGLKALKSAVENNELNEINARDKIQEIEERYPEMWQSIKTNKTLAAALGVVNFYTKGTPMYPATQYCPPVAGL